MNPRHPNIPPQKVFGWYIFLGVQSATEPQDRYDSVFQVCSTVGDDFLFQSCLGFGFPRFSEFRGFLKVAFFHGQKTRSTNIHVVTRMEHHVPTIFAL